MSDSSISADLSGFLADMAEHRRSGRGDLAELMARKADLLERIAAERPGDTLAAEVAANARANADR